MEREHKGRPGFAKDGWRPTSEGHRPQIDRGHQPTFSRPTPAPGISPPRPVVGRPRRRRAAA